MLNHAITAAMRGWHVFPVEPGGKRPIRIYQDRTEEEAPWTIRWSEVATTDLKQIVKWWSYAPNANIGIACKPSGLHVVDCDIPKRDGLLRDTPWAYLHGILGPLVDGETVFDQMAEKYGGAQAVAECFDSYSVATGSGGLHVYFEWPIGVVSSQQSPVEGVLDVRGNGGERGGYVLAAGSQTNRGGYVVKLQGDVRACPGWLVEVCRERERYRPPSSPLRQPRNLNFGGLVNSVRTAGVGNRNNALLWAARAMCADGADEEEAGRLLIPPYMENGGEGGERQANQTIRSAFRLQVRKM